MKFRPTAIPEVVVVELDVHRDKRGYFLESYHKKKYAEAGIPGPFVQDNASFSERGTLRGLHAQRTKPQGKLVRAPYGEIFDVAVDARRGSPTFGKWVGETLSEANGRQLWIPPGFLHGFCVVSESAAVEYKCTDLYAPEDEIGVIWNDATLGISWPVKNPTLSKKDAVYPSWAEIQPKLPSFSK